MRVAVANVRLTVARNRDCLALGPFLRAVG